jgi:circadian clock protein KaiB
MKAKKSNIKHELQNELTKRQQKKYVLRLYIAGLSPRSQKAINNVKKICDENLPGDYELEIQDIYKNPIIAKNGQILAVPALIKELPLPIRKFVGDMSLTEKLLVGLDLISRK